MTVLGGHWVIWGLQRPHNTCNATIFMTPQFGLKAKILMIRARLGQNQEKKSLQPIQRGKNIISQLAMEKKTHCEFSARGPTQIINGSPLRVLVEALW